MNLPVDEMTSRWNDKSMKWQVNEMTSQWNDKSMKWQVDEKTSQWNDKSMKWQVNKMSSLWNDKSMKWQVNEWHINNLLNLMKLVVDENEPVSELSTRWNGQAPKSTKWLKR